VTRVFCHPQTWVKIKSGCILVFSPPSGYPCVFPRYTKESSSPVTVQPETIFQYVRREPGCKHLLLVREIDDMSLLASVVPSDLKAVSLVGLLQVDAFDMVLWDS